MFLLGNMFKTYQSTLNNGFNYPFFMHKIGKKDTWTNPPPPILIRSNFPNTIRVKTHLESWMGGSRQAVSYNRWTHYMGHPVGENRAGERLVSGEIILHIARTNNFSPGNKRIISNSANFTKLKSLISSPDCIFCLILPDIVLLLSLFIIGLSLTQPYLLFCLI